MWRVCHVLTEPVPNMFVSVKVNRRNNEARARIAMLAWASVVFRRFTDTNDGTGMNRLFIGPSFSSPAFSVDPIHPPALTFKTYPCTPATRRTQHVESNKSNAAFGDNAKER